MSLVTRARWLMPLQGGVAASVMTSRVPMRRALRAAPGRTDRKDCTVHDVAPPPLDGAAFLDLHERLLESSHVLAGGAFARLAAGELRRVGFVDAGLYLADHEQRHLVPLPPLEDEAALGIDSTVAGR